MFSEAATRFGKSGGYFSLNPPINVCVIFKTIALQSYLSSVSLLFPTFSSLFFFPPPLFLETTSSTFLTTRAEHEARRFHELYIRFTLLGSV